MRNYKIDTRKKKLNYSLEFKYNNEVIKETINLIQLQKEDIILNGEVSDYIINLDLLKSGMLGVVVSTIADVYICTFSLPQLDIKIVEDERLNGLQITDV